MVFSSVPLYLDPPNWQQHPNQQVQQQQQQQICHNNSNQHEQNHQHQLIPLPSSQVPQPHQMGMLNGSGGGGGGGVGPGAQQIRANSMSERARLAKIPPPEVPLKCPRCESNNTKFCYYNNYSLTQPRHFCKTCRRYWTRGGALRNVPVGGGCRRNKRTSSNNSNNKTSSGGGGGAMSAKSGLSLTPQSNMVNGDHHLVSDSRGINVNSLSGSGNGMSFMASLQNIAQLGGMSNNMMSNIAQLAFSPNSNTTPLGGLGSGVGAGGAGAGYNLGFPQQQQQQQQQQVQFPNFLGGFEIPGSSEGNGGLYSTLFQNIQHRHHNNNNVQVIEDGNEVEEHQPQELLNVNNMSKSCSSTNMMTSVKMEDNNNNGQQRLNLAKQLMMGISSSTDNNHNHNNNLLSRNINHSNSNNSNNNQFWGGNMTNGAAVTSMWTDLSGLNSSSTSHLL